MSIPVCNVSDLNTAATEDLERLLTFICRNGEHKDGIVARERIKAILSARRRRAEELAKR